jgi:hypothetical protein
MNDHMGWSILVNNCQNEFILDYKVILAFKVKILKG